MIIFGLSMLIVLVVIAVREFPDYGYFGREWRAIQAWVKPKPRRSIGVVTHTVSATETGWHIHRGPRQPIEQLAREAELTGWRRPIR